MEARIDWISDGIFRIGDLMFKDGGPHGLKTTSEEVIIRKSRQHLEFYQDLIDRHHVASVLEVGMYEAGSALAFAALYPEMNISSVDLRAPNPAAEAHAGKFGDRLRLHYNTSQDDAEALKRIHKSDFGGAPLDMVIDDASHFYELTKATFEACFPMLRPGGIYVIEDWGWAHWSGWQNHDHPWADKPAMSNLIWELVMACATSPNLIAKVECDISNFVIHKGKNAPAGQSVSTANLWKARGKNITLL